MKHRWKKVFAFSLLPIVLLGSAGYMYRGVPARGGEADFLVLLVPDDVNASNMALHRWIDAAAEDGVHLTVMHDSEFLNPMRDRRGTLGVIVPDLIHRSANGALIGALHDYVAGGGNLMVVYDACTWDLNGQFSKVESRLSDLVGVSYGLYDRYRTASIRWTPVWGHSSAMADLFVPPGKYVAATDQTLTAGLKPAAAARSGLPLAEPSADDVVLTRYQYGNVEYPTFVTEGAYDGAALLEGSGGLVAGLRKTGLGRVLFVNLPLGYLEGRTDGLMLHSFLKYFAVDVLGVPYVAGVPDGVGGLVFNWHVDARSSIKPLDTLIAAGIFNQGPYSIHFTAGPDVDAFGDGKGLDVAHNPDSQRLIAELAARGHNIGSHGGWIHNYFGEHLSDSNQAEFEKYLAMNKDALEKVTGRPITEYSAPVGNHPQWVSRWLEHNGIRAYYFAGDTGMAPTQVYRDDTRDGNSIWAFPIVHLGKYASMEEMGFDSVPSSTVQTWLTSVADYAAHQRVARLIYTHPFGATRYIDAVQGMLKHARELSASHRFRWYTMTQLAEFLNARKAVQWNLTEVDDHIVRLEARAAASLGHQTWVLPKSRYTEPRVRRGKAEVGGDAHDWLVIAGNCQDLIVEMNRR